MILLAPVAVGLAAVGVPIVLMYVLKLRRREHMVSSTLLWRRAIDDVQANAPWQRLRPNLLLLLQLLALCALVLALAGPAYTHAQTFNGDLVVIIDESYGMQAHDVAPSRFAVALARARVLAGQLGSGNVMSVIAMSSLPRPVIAESSDQAAIIRAIDGLRVGVTSPNFLTALGEAASLARSGESTRVVVMTSHDSGITGLPMAVPFPVEIDRIGGRLRDLGITAISAGVSGVHTEALVRVSNFGARAAHSDLELYADGQLADVRPVDVPPGQERNLFWTHLPTGLRQLRAHLSLTDDFAGDKTAWAIVGSGKVRRVLLVSRASAAAEYFLQTALALDPSVRLAMVHTSGQRVRLSAAEVAGFDLIVFDGVLPVALPPTSSLLINPPAGSAGALRVSRVAPVAGVLAPAQPVGPVAALLRYVSLSDVHVAAARRITMPGWMQTVAQSGNMPLIAAGQGAIGRMALIAFDLERSDWPLRISFPVMLQNLLDYLAPGLTVGATDLSTGQVLSLQPPAGVKGIEIVKPGGGIDRLHLPIPPFADTGRPGIYTVHAIGASVSPVAFAVNFFPSRAAYAPGPATRVFGHIQKGSSHGVSVPVSLAWVCAVVGLVGLTAEWWLAFRR